jgi:hypothetical protein
MKEEAIKTRWGGSLVEGYSWRRPEIQPDIVFAVG